MRSRRGVSDAVAVLALVVAAVAVGVVIALFATPYVRAAASREGLSITTAILRVVSGSRAILVVGLTNVGDAALTVGAVSLAGPGSPSCSAATPLPTIPPGQSAEVRLECSNVSRDASYVVSVSAKSPAGRDLVWQAKVRAQ